MKSSVEQPFYRNLESELESMPSPHTPLISCANAAQFPYINWNPGHVLNDDFRYTYGGYSQCIESQFPMLPPSFNFNYDYSTHRGSNVYQLATGILCTNCYVFIGASFYVHFEYLYSTGAFGVEADFIGGLGANVELSVTNPSVNIFNQFSLLAAVGTLADIPLILGKSTVCIMLDISNGALRNIFAVPFTRS